MNMVPKLIVNKPSSNNLWIFIFIIMLFDRNDYICTLVNKTTGPDGEIGKRCGLRSR